jgi:isoleucyl-tRNA synthetase
LNIKDVVWHEATDGPLLTAEVKANLRTLGPKAGPGLQQVRAAVERFSAEALTAGTRNGKSIEMSGVPIDAADFTIRHHAAVGWAGVAEGDAQVALNTQLDENLITEGMAREVVRHVQEARKKAGLEMEDRIELSLTTEAEELKRALAEHFGYIASETLVQKWADGPLSGGSYQVTVSVDGHGLSIALQKA